MQNWCKRDQKVTKKGHPSGPFHNPSGRPGEFHRHCLGIWVITFSSDLRLSWFLRHWKEDFQIYNFVSNVRWLIRLLKWSKQSPKTGKNTLTVPTGRQTVPTVGEKKETVWFCSRSVGTVREGKNPICTNRSNGCATRGNGLGNTCPIWTRTPSFIVLGLRNCLYKHLLSL